MIIKIEPNFNNSHANQSLTPQIIPDGWIEVPYELECDFIACGSFCDLAIENGILTGICPLPIPAEPAPPVAPQEDSDALLVDHEYRLTLMELGVTPDAV